MKIPKSGDWEYDVNLYTQEAQLTSQTMLAKLGLYIFKLEKQLLLCSIIPHPKIHGTEPGTYKVLLNVGKKRNLSIVPLLLFIFIKKK